MNKRKQKRTYIITTVICICAVCFGCALLTKSEEKDYTPDTVDTYIGPIVGYTYDTEGKSILVRDQCKWDHCSHKRQ